jgi:predicted nucleic acid-binding protein
MSRQVLLDTGLLVVFINPRDNFHEWAVTEWAASRVPLLTCEAVITEACFLLRKVYRGEEAVMSLLAGMISRYDGFFIATVNGFYKAIGFMRPPNFDSTCLPLA